MDNEPRMLPNNISAEGSVLSAMLIDQSCIALALDLLDESDFYRKAHKLIFSAAESMFREDRHIDAITILDELKRTDKLDAVGGVEYIQDIIDAMVSSASMRHHAEVVVECSKRRKLIMAGWYISEMAFTSTDNSDDMIGKADAQIQSISNNVVEDSTIGSAIMQAYQLMDDSGKSTGCGTGYYSVDSLFGNFRPGQLVILGARPKMGKTAFALEIAKHACRDGMRVAFFSLEMSKEELVLRMLAQLTSATMDDLFVTNEYDASEVGTGIQVLEQMQLYIDDTAGMSPNRIKSRSMQIQKLHGKIDLIIIDYLQLMKSDTYYRSRYEEITSISRECKVLAKKLKTPVLALAQLNRELENREDKRPRLSDLRDSGSLEQDADKVYFIYRDEVYNEPSDHPGTAEIICRKNRNGQDGIASLHWDGSHIRFNQFTKMEKEN